MSTKKYPVGTTIVFIANSSMCCQAKQDDGKKGKVIGETTDGKAMICLPDSVKKWGTEYTWNTDWDNIKPVITKGQQLLFSFME